MGCEDHAGLRVRVCSVRGRLRAGRTGPARRTGCADRHAGGTADRRLTYAQKSVLLQIVRHGDMQPADGNHRRTFQSLEERGYTQDVGYGRYAITEAGRRALQKDLS